jgi:hypothetical protein
MQVTWPTIFQGALDYLPIQASSVLSERIFSLSAEMDTKKHNCINPILMESLQMLKFALKKARLNFTGGWITSENVMLEQVSDQDLLAALFAEDSEDAMDRIIQNFAADNSDDDSNTHTS